MKIPQLHELLLSFVDVGEFIYHPACFDAEPFGIRFILTIYVKLIGLDWQTRRRVVIQPDEMPQTTS